MDNHTPAAPLAPVADIVTDLIRGDQPLEVALAAWRECHGLRLTDVSALIGRQPAAVSAMLHDPARCPSVRRAVAELIGYQERRSEPA